MYRMDRKLFRYCPLSNLGIVPYFGCVLYRDINFNATVYNIISFKN